jgi:pimeloyl-ACP methyl ester carboxylesterase
MNKRNVAAALLTVSLAATVGACGGRANATTPAPVPPGFRSETAEVNGIRVHYVIGGQGEPMVLLHGWPQTWFEWHRVMPSLAEKYTVVVPDLRGAGDSDAPAGGYDKKTLAEDLRALLDKVGAGPAHLVGHDLGVMVAYAFAARYPERVKTVVLADAPIPGIEPGWSQASCFLWHFGFHNAKGISERLVEGRERDYLTWFYETFSVKKNAFTEEEVNEFVRAYARPGRMTAGFEWYRAFDADAAHNRELQRNKLAMPILVMGSELSGASPAALGEAAVPGVVKAVTIAGSGHWMLEEQPELFLKELRAFLEGVQ